MVLDDSLPMWGFVGKLEKVASASPSEPEKHKCAAAERARLARPPRGH